MRSRYTPHARWYVGEHRFVPPANLRRALCRFLQIGEHPSRMAFRLYFGKDVLNLAVLSNDERGPDNAHDFLTVHILFLKHTEGVSDFLVGIRQQREGQLKFIL